MAVHDLDHGRPDLAALLGQLPAFPLPHQPGPIEQGTGVLHGAQPLGHRRLVDPQRTHRPRGLATRPDQGHERLEPLKRLGPRSVHRAILLARVGILTTRASSAA
ncbi:MAG TPA: hypothetical protein VFF52_02435 [Isosphaeraceae bacterium]|nr:hypothetical protein [Isosphaeraceae bacterium]